MIACSRCQTRSAVSVGCGVCSFCLYAEQVGPERAAEQESRRVAELELVKAKPKAARPRERSR